VKDKDEFYTRKDSGKPLSYCITCQSELKDLKFQENIERIILERGCACQDCGVPYPAPVYEFYLDGAIYNLSKARNMSFEKLATNLQGYAMLCRNCSALRDWERG
jgi:DNA-directed RNA polymerase subunit RPC12/RpoP